MHLSQIRQYLHRLSVVFVVLAIIIAVWCIVWPMVELPAKNIDHHAVNPLSTPTSDADALPSLDALAPIYALPLQGPLKKPPPSPKILPPPPPPPPPPRPITVKLIGTIIELNRSQALFIEPNGTSRFAAVGDKIDHVTIESIKKNQVQLRREDQTIVTLDVPINDELPR